MVNPADNSFPRALAEALRARATGAIVSRLSPVRKIWIKAGEPVFVESEDPRERYTQVLLRHGKLTKTEVLLIEGEFSGEEISEEDALRASEMVPPKEVAHLGMKVFEERLFNAFDARGGFWFEASAIPKGLAQHPLPAAGVLMRGLRERWNAERLADELPVSESNRFVFDAEEAARFSVRLAKAEEALAARLDGKRTWKDALEDAVLSARDAHALVAAWWMMGLAAPRKKGTTGSFRAPSKKGASGSHPRARKGLSGPKPRIEPVSARASAEEMRTRAGLELPEVLGVPLEADIPTVDASFRALVARFELGRAHQLPDAEREAALALLDRAIDAFLVMTHVMAREPYFEAAPWDRENVAASLGAKLSPEKHFVRAGVFLEAKNFLAAEAAMLPALQLEPQRSAFHLRLGIAIYQRAAARGPGTIPAGAARALEKAAALDPTSWEAWLHLGHVAIANGDAGKAKALYQRSLTANPRAPEPRAALDALIAHES